MEQSILIQQAKKPFWVELNYSVCFIMFSGCIILFFYSVGNESGFMRCGPHVFQAIRRQPVYRW